MKSHTIELAEKEQTFSATDTKEMIVARLGLPDLDVGNGCCNAMPDVLKYGDCEFHFTCEQLTQIRLGEELLKFDD